MRHGLTFGDMRWTDWGIGIVIGKPRLAYTWNIQTIKLYMIFFRYRNGSPYQQHYNCRIFIQFNFVFFLYNYNRSGLRNPFISFNPINHLFHFLIMTMWSLCFLIRKYPHVFMRMFLCRKTVYCTSTIRSLI